MKMVIKICLVQQMTKKFAVEVDAKIWGEKVRNGRTEKSDPSDKNLS